MRMMHRDGQNNCLIPNRLELKTLLLWNLRGNLAVWAFDRFNLRKRWAINRCWKRVKKRHKKECLIIAGGPSYTEEIAEALKRNRKGLEIIAINHYHLSRFKDDLVPSYYILSDPDTLSLDPEAGRQLISYIDSHKITTCTPYGASWVDKSWETMVFNDSENVYSRNIDPRKPRGYASNTAFKAIAIAFRLGYKKIYVVGLDHDYPRRLSVTKDLRLTLDDAHHYEMPQEEPAIYPYFECMAHALHCYALNLWHLRKLHSPKIVNVTDSSMVDVFERVSKKDFIEYLTKEIGMPDQYVDNKYTEFQRNA